MKARLARNLFGIVLLLNGVLLLNVGCSSATKNLGSLGDPLKRISVQRTPAAGVSITRKKEEDRYDFYISLLDESGEPSKTYIVKGFSEQAKAQFYGNLNSVIINDKSEILYALVVDKDIEYRRHLDDPE
ncbi:MAG: hypothetical protein IH937_06140 [Acidobacteria bacterium]|nr:hypothetical protein [Acidobacteriota bacterium]